MDPDYFQEFGIKQVYVSKYLEQIHKNIFYDEYNLFEYKNKNLSTLFVGIKDKNDIDVLYNHEKNIYLLLNESDFEIIINKSERILKNKNIKNIFVTLLLLNMTIIFLVIKK